MSKQNANIFTLNNCEYDLEKLCQDGKYIIGLINSCQAELEQIETKKLLMQAAQQQLINQLKPLLKGAEANSFTGQLGIIGNASVEIPSTDAKKPTEHPAPFPENIPDEIRA